MTSDESRAAFFDLWFVRMLTELGDQAEWGYVIGRELVHDDPEDPWSRLHSFALHSAAVGSFVETLAMRSPKLDAAFPDRANMIRTLLRIDHDFSSAKAVRDTLVHMDERIESRWHDLVCDDPAEPPELFLRTFGDADDPRLTMVRWDRDRKILSTARKVGPGYDSVDVAATTNALLRAREWLIRWMHPDDFVI